MTLHNASALNLGVYLITDDRPDVQQLFDIVGAAIAGGVTCVQLRRKKTLGREFVQLARELRNRTAAHGVHMVINDRVDIAAIVNADGVHVGQDDIHVHDARRLLGPGKIIGVSVDTVEEAVAAERDGADYVGVGAVYATNTKADAGYTGLDGLETICACIGIPVVGIGGITLTNATAVIARGASGVAVVSALMQASDPTQAARTLAATVTSATTARVTPQFPR